MKLFRKIKANLVFSIEIDAFWKSIWIGPLLIVWSTDTAKPWIQTLEFEWYGFDYWFEAGVVIDDLIELNSDKKDSPV